MNEIKIFSSHQFGEIRTAINENGDPLFCLNDLCLNIGINNSRAVKSRLDEGDVSQIDTPTTSGVQSMTFVNESGMYDVIIRSDSENAKPFRKWVTSEVLPAIRKHGGYLTSQKVEEALMNPDILIRLATELKTERQEKERLQVISTLQAKELKDQAPKAEYYDSVLDSEDLIATTLIAKDLGMSAVALNKKLFNLNIIYRCQGTWVVTAKYQALGYAKSKSFPHLGNDGQMHTSIFFYWTQKGREFIIKKLTA
ncbi:MAG: phage antirepressor KilAC domain-containing protein [Paludibacter sp.]|nr:phage antirepressor KilAC domain-containing protein [Paludibacter sp.]